MSEKKNWWEDDETEMGFPGDKEDITGILSSIIREMDDPEKDYDSASDEVVEAVPEKAFAVEGNDATAEEVDGNVEPEGEEEALLDDLVDSVKDDNEDKPIRYGLNRRR